MASQCLVQLRSAGVKASELASLRSHAHGASSLPPHARSHAGTQRARVVRASASGDNGALWASLSRKPWDAAPVPWRQFWAVKLAAAVVESDAAAGEVRVTPVEGVGLQVPPSLDEAQRRVRTNLVLYRQNYILGALLVAAVGALRHAALLAALVAGAVALASSSDRLLGELALASDGRLLWNAKRVAGLDRASLRAAAAACAVACLALSPRDAAAWLLRASLLSCCLIVTHAVLRPVDLQSALASFWGDVTSAKSREDVVRSFNAVGDRLSRWWGDKAKTPDEPVPVVVVQRGTAAPPPQQPQVSQLPKKLPPGGAK